ncbi:hypothetical protein [Streptomyces luteogriseus]|uniref:hypothetical protein n=1 Tax=Streptomyces luteogriseus TaxID=68233 RepID=UPI0037F750C3
MTPRCDMTLEWHLREVVAKEAVDGSVKEAVRAVFTHMHSGRSRRRRGGRELVRLLEETRSAAADADEWQVVRLVQDAIEYAEGRILRYDFEDRYRLFGDGGQAPSSWSGTPRCIPTCPRKRSPRRCGRSTRTSPGSRC